MEGTRGYWWRKVNTGIGIDVGTLHIWNTAKNNYVNHGALKFNKSKIIIVEYRYKYLSNH